MAANHHSHTGPLLLRPLPLPGELPRVQSRHIGQQPLSRLVPGKPYDSYGFISEEQLDYTAPESYIRWVQPIERELDKQVEYDMDAVDAEWLELYNGERSRTGEEPVLPEVFEIIMDRLEKEWFDLNSRIPKASHEASDGICAICDDGEAEQSNAIVFCDGCNLSVHQDCYGVPYIPADQWLCRKCTVSPNKPVSCCLCPNEVGVCNSVYMEPIDGIENIHKSRWRLTCYLCKQRTGACIQCYRSSCTVAFHATCARDYGLNLELIKGEDSSECKGWCHKHKPVQTIEEEEDVSAAASEPGSALSRRDSMQSSYSRPIRQRCTPPPPERRTKSASNQAYAKSFVSTGPPIIPEMIATNVYNWLARIKLKRKREAVNAVCRFWSLKRESRRGAGFLKRLHLEPWTAKAQRAATNAEVDDKKLEYMHKLRRDLENVRMLCEQVKKRERLKQRRIDEFRKAVEPILFPMEESFWEVLEQVGAQDKEDTFLLPVTRAMAPDYHDIIKKPVDWMTIGNRIQKHQYLSVDAFKSDIRLVYSNALHYNRPESPIHRAAQRLQVEAEPVLSKLDVWLTPQHQARQAVLLTLLTEARVQCLFDLDKELDPASEASMPADIQLDDPVEADAAVSRGDLPRRPKNKRDRLQEQKERQARIEAEAAEKARAAAELAAQLAAEQQRLAEEEAERQAAAEKAIKDQKRREAAAAQKEKKRLAKLKQDESRQRWRAKQKQKRLEERLAREQARASQAVEEVKYEKPKTRTREQKDAQNDAKPAVGKMPIVQDNSGSSDLSELSDVDGSGDEGHQVAHHLTSEQAAPTTSPTKDTRVTISIPPRSPTAKSALPVQAGQPPQPQSQPVPTTSTEAPAVTVEPSQSLKRRRQSSLSSEGQPAAKRKKSGTQRAFEYDAPSEEQLLSIELPPFEPARTSKAQESRIRELKAEACCKLKTLHDGDQVWAYLTGFPSWPAQVVVDKGETIPPGYAGAVKVVFFDEGRHTAELPTTSLHMLGDNVEFDSLMINSPVMRKRDSKSKSKILHDLRNAYRAAKWNWQGRESAEE